jgi:hypothetical protein
LLKWNNKDSIILICSHKSYADTFQGSEQALFAIFRKQLIICGLGTIGTVVAEHAAPPSTTRTKKVTRLEQIHEMNSTHEMP